MFEIELLLSQINIDLQDIEIQQQELLNQEIILIKDKNQNIVCCILLAMSSSFLRSASLFFKSK